MLSQYFHPSPKNISSRLFNEALSALCPCQSGGAGGSQHAAVLQAVRSGKSSSYTGDVALVLGRWQVNTALFSIHAQTLYHCIGWHFVLGCEVWNVSQRAEEIDLLFFPSLFLLLSPLPQTAGEWAQVLQLQRQFHQAQLSKWQQILQSSVTLLDQVGVFECVLIEVKRVNLTHFLSPPIHVCLPDEAVFGKASPGHRGPRGAAGSSWRRRGRDSDWRLSPTSSGLPECLTSLNTAWWKKVT